MSSLRPITLLIGLLVLPALAFAQEQGEGVTPDGRKGQIYKVQKGDTLWAISQKYLGTPWIWPSVWKENEAKIADPHSDLPRRPDLDLERVDAQADARGGCAPSPPPASFRPPLLRGAPVAHAPRGAAAPSRRVIRSPRSTPSR